jgi:hypothetical protein
LFKLHFSFFQKELVLGRRVGAELLASIEEHLCTNPKKKIQEFDRPSSLCCEI